MKKQIQFSTEVTEFDSETELPQADQDLLKQARLAAKRAYAPYSNFEVGASLRLANGKVIDGNNQENMAYPSGLCAERVAIFAASSQFPNEKVEAMAITAQSGDFEVNHPVGPCGSCRQVLFEYESKQGNPIRLILAGETGKVQVIENVNQLLPLTFREEGLKKKR